MTERKTIYEESTAFVNEYVDRVPKPLKNLFLILFSGHNILFLFFCHAYDDDKGFFYKSA